MKTGEFHCTTQLHAELRGGADIERHMVEKLYYNISKELVEALKGGAETAVTLGRVTTAPASRYYADDVIEYRLRFTALLLDWHDAEIGDCVHMNSIDGCGTAYMPDGVVFAWKGQWWERTE